MLERCKYCAVIIVSYCLAGYLGGLLAVPPTYSTAVWPASGIALASILIVGARAIFPVFLGAFFTSLYLLGGVTFGNAFLASIMGFCGAGQAYLGAWLIQRYADGSECLNREQSIVYATVLSGPLSCMLSATFSNLALLYFSDLRPFDYTRSWLTWWVGDSIGVMVFFPLVLLGYYALKNSERRRRFYGVALPVSLTVLAVVLGFILSNGVEQRGEDFEFSEKSNRIVASIEDRIEAKVTILRSVKNFFMSSRFVGPEEFASFTDAFLQYKPYLKSLNWVEVVPAAERLSYENRLSLRLGSGSVIREFNPDSRRYRPAASRDLYFPTTYLNMDSKDAILPLTGVDFGGESLRRNTLLEAMETGELSMSVPLRPLNPGRGDHRELFLVQPIVLPRDKSSAYPGAPRKILGFAIAALSFDSLIESSLREFNLRSFNLTIHDVTDDQPLPLIRKTAAPIDNLGHRYQDLARQMENHYVFDFGNRRWDFVIRPSVEYFTKHGISNSWVVLVMGMVFSTFLSVMLLTMTGRSQMVELSVKEKTTQLQHANEVKSKFLANMSHEIRTPLNGILGIADNLLHADLPDETRKKVETISSCGESLLTILNDILDFSKLEADGFKISHESFDIRSLIQNSVRLMQAKAEENRNSIRAIIEPSMPRWIVSDSIRIRQVILNLLSNANKFTQGGHIEVVGRVGDDGSLSISVKDTGIGISKEDQAGLFQPFSQAEKSRTRRSSGTGLGLAISKGLCQLMGGDITFESAEGLGSIFSINLPLIEGEEPKVNKMSDLKKDDLKDLRVLLAEDNEINQMVASNILQQLGVEPDIAGDGDEAIEMFRRSGPYDVIFMDCQMPNLDGLSATRYIREHWSRKDQPVIVALTASAMADEKDLCFSAGMDDFMSKPVSSESFRSCLMKIKMRTSRGNLVNSYGDV